MNLKLYLPSDLSTSIIHKILNLLLSGVWLINGLFCKVLNMVPRHQEIVGEILGKNHAPLLTEVIGLAESAMAVWILSGIQPRMCALTQIGVVLSMNVLESWLVPDLLLWGRWNLIFALLFSGLVYYNEFVLNSKRVRYE